MTMTQQKMVEIISEAFCEIDGVQAIVETDNNGIPKALVFHTTESPDVGLVCNRMIDVALSALAIGMNLIYLSADQESKTVAKSMAESFGQDMLQQVAHNIKQHSKNMVGLTLVKT